MQVQKTRVRLRLRQPILAVFILSAFSSLGFAQDSVTRFAGEIRAHIKPINKKPPTVSKVEGSVDVEASHYTTSLPDNQKLDQSYLMTGKVKIHQKSEIFEGHVDALAGKYLNWGGSHFAVQELYGSSQNLLKKTNIAFGRKIEFWSQLDQDWQLGLWEPKYNLDPLRPYNQGLTGLFVKYEDGPWELLALASPVFVPTMGPEIKEKDGSLVSDSRWYRSPSPEGPIMGEKTDIVYSLEIPDIQKLVTNPGYAARARYGKTTDGLWLSANAAYKPINNLALKYDASLAITDSAAEGQVSVSPAVVYHKLMGADIGWNFSKAMISASWLQDRPERYLPENPNSDTDWVLQQPGDMDIYGLHFQSWVDQSYFVDPVVIQLDYLKAYEQETRDQASDGSDRGSLFPSRLNFTNAVSVKAALPFRSSAGTRILTQFGLMREIDQNGGLLSSTVTFYPAQKWAWTLGADVLAVDDPSSENTDTRFFNQFRANDRFYSGVTYAF